MKTKTIIILFVSLLITEYAFSQKTREIGILAGGSYYMGDVNHNKLFYKTKLAYGLFYKRNVHDHHSYRIQVLKEQIEGRDADFPSGYQKIRNHNFLTDIYELGVQYEFNFFPYNISKFLKSTTYVTAGASFTYIKNTKDIFKPSIVMGVGAKQGFGKRLTMGIEWTYKYAFSDDLDALPQNTFDPSLTPANNKQVNNINTNDWYSLACIVISYNFASTKKWCPAYRKH